MCHLTLERKEEWYSMPQCCFDSARLGNLRVGHNVALCACEKKDPMLRAFSASTECLDSTMANVRLRRTPAVLDRSNLCHGSLDNLFQNLLRQSWHPESLLCFEPSRSFDAKSFASRVAKSKVWMLQRLCPSAVVRHWQLGFNALLLCNC